ncbi:MAG: hypothetical protein FJ261_15250 [Planctomycetes bacterium]|nr:hypothetical protein [Planctomycetota bacterium]
MNTRLAIAIMMLASPLPGLRAEGPWPAEARAFIKSNCQRCHDGATAKAKQLKALGQGLGQADRERIEILANSIREAVVLAGGGFRHQGHIAFDTARNKPLCNLYVRMLQRFGVETQKFGSSTGALAELPG